MAVDLDYWSVEQLRMTAFTAALVQVEGLDWWERAVGNVAESTQIQPRQGQRVEEGQLAAIPKGRLVLTVAPQRVDWRLVPANPDAGADWPVAGTYADVVGTFRDCCARWLPAAPGLNRLAFGAVLVHPVEDRIEGYRQLSEHFLRFAVDGSTSADLLFQINRPRKSRVVNGLQLNRLCKWASAAVSVVQLTIQPAAEPVRLPAVNAVRVELDINTASDVDALPPSALGGILEELVGLGEELARQGDVP